MFSWSSDPLDILLWKTNQFSVFLVCLNSSFYVSNTYDQIRFKAEIYVSHFTKVWLFFKDIKFRIIRQYSKVKFSPKKHANFFGNTNSSWLNKITVTSYCPEKGLIFRVCSKHRKGWGGYSAGYCRRPTTTTDNSPTMSSAPGKALAKPNVGKANRPNYIHSFFATWL